MIRFDLMTVNTCGSHCIESEELIPNDSYKFSEYENNMLNR